MNWTREETKDEKWLTILARNTKTKEGRKVYKIHLPTTFEKITGSNRYKKQWIHATHNVNMFCIDMNHSEMLERVNRPDLPDKPFVCGKCGSDSWKLIARRWNIGYYLQFHCASCGHSDNIISYESKVSNIEKLVDADMLPNGSQYNPSIEYVSGRE